MRMIRTAVSIVSRWVAANRLGIYDGRRTLIQLIKTEYVVNLRGIYPFSTTRCNTYLTDQEQTHSTSSEFHHQGQHSDHAGKL